MGLMRRGGVFYFVKRVPLEVAALDPRGTVRISLRTRECILARQKAAALEGELVAYWEALAAGREPSARMTREMLVALARARGIVYRAAGDPVDGPFEEILRRISRLERRDDQAAVTAEGGEINPLSLSEAFEDYLGQVADRLVAKSPAQRRRWELPRRRALGNLIEVVGDKPLAELTRDDALAFRDWWAKRLRSSGLKAHSANKNLTHLADFVNTLDRLRRLELGEPFARLKFVEKDGSRRQPFPTEWIRDRLVAPGALDGLNDQACDAFLALVETGLRPAEVLNAAPEDIVLDAEVPHLRIRPQWGARRSEIKNRPSERDVPLLGVSLEAMRRHPAGFPRYHDKAGSWSALVNKVLRARGLLPSEAHSAYSLRHSFEDRLTAVDCPERVKADLMGHALGRVRYGAGPSLTHKAEWINRILVARRMLIAPSGLTPTFGTLGFERR